MASRLAAAETEQAKARHQHDAGQGIELALDAADALVVAREIVPIASRRIGRPARGSMRAKSSSLPLSGAGKTSGQFLVRMVWSGVMTPQLAHPVQILGVDEIAHRLAAAEFKHEAPPGALDGRVLLAAGAAHDRRDMRFAGDIVRLGGDGHASCDGAR